MIPGTRPPHRPARAALCALAAAVVGLGACAQTVKLNSTWSEDAGGQPPFERVMVVAVSPDTNQRCAFEGFLATRIREGGSVAMPSCRALAPGQPLTRESVELAIAEHGIDAVVVTFLVAASAEVREGGTSETRGDAYYKPTGFGWVDPYYYGGAYGVYGVPVVYGEFQTADPLTTLEGAAEIATLVYRTRDAALVYELTTKASELESSVSAFAEITGPVAERLRRDGVIR